jgi:hypothetical protein
MTAGRRLSTMVTGTHDLKPKGTDAMSTLSSSRLAAAGAAVGGAAFAVAGALQATGLNWEENAVETPLQHLAMALFAVGLVAVIPTLAALARRARGRGRYGWVAMAAGQSGVAAAATVSNIRGADAAWFPAVAVAANGLWVVGTFALAFALWRARLVSRLVAAGLVVAYVGAIPAAAVGGGIVTGCYWLAVGYLLTLGALERRVLRPATL